MWSPSQALTWLVKTKTHSRLIGHTFRTVRKSTAGLFLRRELKITCKLLVMARITTEWVVPGHKHKHKYSVDCFQSLGRCATHVSLSVRKLHYMWSDVLRSFASLVWCCILPTALHCKRGPKAVKRELAFTFIFSWENGIWVTKTRNGNWPKKDMGKKVDWEMRSIPISHLPHHVFLFPARATRERGRPQPHRTFDYTKLLADFWGKLA